MDKKVSIIIPVKNEEKYIGKCLESMLKQDFPKSQMEIIVVDGMSSDSSKKVVKSYINSYPDTDLDILDNKKEIVPAAMNLGIREAKGDYIIRIDAHSRYEDDYISKCVEYLDNKPEVWNVGGPMRAISDSFLGKAISFIHHCPFGLGGGKFHNSEFEGYVDTVYLGAFRREVFDEVGLYNEKLVRNQDIELNSRIRNAGGKIYLTPEIKSYYYNRDTVSGFIKQNFRNGLWNIITTKINSNALSLRHFIPLIFVLSIILGGELFFVPNFSLIGKIIFLGVLSSYFLVAFYFSLAILKEKGLKYFIITPFLFFMLHFSYGLGSIFGLLKCFLSSN